MLHVSVGNVEFKSNYRGLFLARVTLECGYGVKELRRHALWDYMDQHGHLDTQALKLRF